MGKHSSKQFDFGLSCVNIIITACIVCQLREKVITRDKNNVLELFLVVVNIALLPCRRLCCGGIKGDPKIARNQELAQKSGLADRTLLLCVCVCVCMLMNPMWGRCVNMQCGGGASGCNLAIIYVLVMVSSSVELNGSRGPTADRNPQRTSGRPPKKSGLSLSHQS